MTVIEGREQGGDEKPPHLSSDTKSTPPPPYGPPRLRIVGATWGGVKVTADIQDMVSASQTVVLDVRTIHQILQPDPAPYTIKLLTVLYQYEGQDHFCLLNIPENRAKQPVNIWQTAHLDPSPYQQLQKLGDPWRDESGDVDILAVLYGPQLIDTPSVLQELAKFFGGRRGQIRMTNTFFKTDTWPYHKKSWTVYFRFVDSKIVQCVTGLEDGALEIPWGRF